MWITYIDSGAVAFRIQEVLGFHSLKLAVMRVRRRWIIEIGGSSLLLILEGLSLTWKPFIALMANIALHLSRRRILQRCIGHWIFVEVSILLDKVVDLKGCIYILLLVLSFDWICNHVPLAITPLSTLQRRIMMMRVLVALKKLRTGGCISWLTISIVWLINIAAAIIREHTPIHVLDLLQPNHWVLGLQTTTTRWHHTSILRELRLEIVRTYSWSYILQQMSVRFVLIELVQARYWSMISLGNWSVYVKILSLIAGSDLLDLRFIGPIDIIVTLLRQVFVSNAWGSGMFLQMLMSIPVPHSL